jgi:hypothetical protein
VLESARPVTYSSVQYEAACRAHLVRIAYRNTGFEPGGIVERFEVDGQPVPRAVATLQLRAAGRPIYSIAIRNCGFDAPSPAIKGDMSLPAVDGLRPNLTFELKREEGIWKLAIVR